RMPLALQTVCPQLQKAYPQRMSALILSLLLLPAVVAHSQDGGSLADTARQIRAQKPSQPGAAAIQAQQIADEMSEDQNSKNAAGGFKDYNAGAYKVSLPTPYSVGGHDEAGIVLTGPRVGQMTMLVLVANSLVLPSKNDDAFRDVATQF